MSNVKIYRLKPYCIGSNGVVFYKVQVSLKNIFGKVIWVNFDEEILDLDKARIALKQLRDFEKVIDQS